MSTASLLVVALAIVLLAPLLARGVRGHFDPFEPIVLFVLAYGVMFVARPASMLANHELSYFDIDIRNTLPRALLLALGGGVAFVCSYELRAGRALARALPAPHEIPKRAGSVYAGSLVVLALAALLVTVWPAHGSERVTVLLGGQTPEYARLISAAGAYVFDSVMLVVPAALLLLALALRDRRPLLVAAAVLTFGFALLLLVPLGARTFLLPLIGGGITFAYVSRGVRPRLVTIVLIAILALVASYTLKVLRTPHTHLGPTVRQLVTHPETPLDYAINGDDAEMAPVFAAALQVVPSQLHYRYGGATVGDLVTRPIPRQLWAGKPRPVEDQLVSAIWPSYVKYFHPAFSSLLFFYWDFGIPGVFLGMALFGLGCRTLYEWFLCHRNSLSAQLIFATSVWLVVSGVRSTPVDTIVLASFVVLPLVLLERATALRGPIFQPLLARVRLSQR